MVTVDEALRYMGIDYVDDVVRANAELALNTAVQTLYGAVGEDTERYLPDDPRIAYLVLTYTDSLYSDRGVSAKVDANVRRMVADLELQLRMELRQAKGAGV